MKVKIRVADLEKFRGHITRIEIEEYGVNLVNMERWVIDTDDPIRVKHNLAMFMDTSGRVVNVPKRDVATVTLIDYDKQIEDIKELKAELLDTMLELNAIIKAGNE